MIELITGTPGAGKTLLTVSKVLAPMVGKTLTNEDGVEFPRRLCIGGIPDLLLPHDPVTVTTFDPERGAEPSDGRARLPGTPPLDVERCAHNWWQWCEPGDVIVIDECQRVFRPMASGRKAPMMVSMLETHRHYGVDIVLITQHPQLLHANVRSLVGKHRHVRRMFGGLQRMVYEWDQCSAVDRRRDATATTWRPDKSAYSLYKSSQLHTKAKFSVPLPLIVALIAVVGLPVALWFAYQRLTNIGNHAASVAPVSAVSASRPGAPPMPPRPSSGPQPWVPPDTARVPQSASAPLRAKSSGCIHAKGVCRCINADGYFLKLPLSFCEELLANHKHPPDFNAIPVLAAARRVNEEGHWPRPIELNRNASSSDLAINNVTATK